MVQCNVHKLEHHLFKDLCKVQFLIKRTSKIRFIYMNYIFPNQVLTHTYLLAHFLIIASPKSNQTSPGTLSHLKATLPPLILICLTQSPP